MKKSLNYILILIIAILIYVLFLGQEMIFTKKGSSPTIQINQDLIEVSVKASDKQLLQGLSASDPEDGDLTNQIQIESISDLDENMQRSVTYLVFDSDDNMTKATRKIQYSDYQPPKIYLTKPLIYYSLPSSQELMKYVQVKSSLDGNISDRVTINFIEKDDIQYVKFSVTDSANQTSELTLKEDRMNKEPSINIQLSDYLLYVDINTHIDAMDYVKTVTYFGNEYRYLINQIEVISNYDSSQTGIYEIIYQITLNNGEIGMTKLVVIVE